MKEDSVSQIGSIVYLLGTFSRYTKHGAIVVADTAIMPDLSQEKLSPLEVAIRFDEGYVFGIGTHLPRFLDEHLKNGQEMPEREDKLVTERGRDLSSLADPDNPERRWGYLEQYLKIVDEMKNRPEYRLLVKKKGGGFKTVITHKNITLIQAAAEDICGRYRQAGSLSDDRLKEVIRLFRITEGKGQKEVPFEEMKTLLFE